MNEYADAAVLKSMVLIDALLEIVTDVVAPLFVNVAVPSGTLDGLQLVPWVHSPGNGDEAIQVASVASAVSGAKIASAPSQMLVSSAARSDNCAGAAARLACERGRCERIPQPPGASAALPTPPRVTDTWLCAPRWGSIPLR